MIDKEVLQSCHETLQAAELMIEGQLEELEQTYCPTKEDYAMLSNCIYQLRHALDFTSYAIGRIERCL